MRTQLSNHKDMFALKTLHEDNYGDKDFQQEVNMLRRFHGHTSIVKLLATVTRQIGQARKEYSLLFPWAAGDLISFWKSTELPPTANHSIYLWICHQMQSLTDAIKHIHSPNKRNLDGGDLFGRHGDLKPENVLWFRKDEENTLMIADLGFSVVYRKISRSAEAGHRLQVTATYRAPECEMKGQDGRILRSFDIWTLGS